MTLSRMSWILISHSHTSETVITLQSKLCRKVLVSTNAALVWDISCPLSKVPLAAASMPVWKSERFWSVFLLAWFRVMLSSEEAQNPNATKWLEKTVNQFSRRTSASGTDKSSTLLWHHTMRFDAGNKRVLKFWETVLTKCRDPEKNEDFTTSGSLKDRSSFFVQDHAQSLQILNPKREMLTPCLSKTWVSVDTLPVSPE